MLSGEVILGPDLHGVHICMEYVYSVQFCNAAWSKDRSRSACILFNLVHICMESRMEGSQDLHVCMEKDSVQ